MAEIPAAVGAELSGGFTASFLMFLEFGGASKPTDVADFQLLAGLHSNASRQAGDGRLIHVGRQFARLGMMGRSRLFPRLLRRTRLCLCSLGLHIRITNTMFADSQIPRLTCSRKIW